MIKQYKITKNNITYDFYKNDHGTNFWYKNGEPHLENGPAIEYSNGEKEYWYNGKRLENIKSDEELKRYIKLLFIS